LGLIEKPAFLRKIFEAMVCVDFDRKMGRAGITRLALTGLDAVLVCRNRVIHAPFLSRPHRGKHHSAEMEIVKGGFIGYCINLNPLGDCCLSVDYFQRMCIVLFSKINK